MTQSLRSNITPFIYGTTRLRHDDTPFNHRVEMAKIAMETGVWFHTSHQYDNALEVLNKAFKENPARIPKLIVKLGWHSIIEIRDNIKWHLDALDVDAIEVGQLCLENPLKRDFEQGGSCYEELQKIKDEGLIRHWLLEVFPWTSDTALKSLKGGFAKNILDGYIFYLNPLQRFASNPLWDLLVKNQKTVISMRTVAGGPVHRLRDVPGAAWKEYLQKRAVEVVPVFEKSGIDNWTEFCMRFAHSFSHVVATVGSTSSKDNFQDFISAQNNIKPLPQSIIDDLVKLAYRWSEETDVKAEPWSM